MGLETLPGGSDLNYGSHQGRRPDASDSFKTSRLEEVFGSRPLAFYLRAVRRGV